jgi:hypothetical protein
MHLVLTITNIAVWLTFAVGQTSETPAYVRRGDQAEQHFREHRNKLAAFHAALRAYVEIRASQLLPQMDDAPPQPVVWGYDILPEIVDEPAQPGGVRFASRRYNWKLTDEYVSGEEEKLRRATLELDRLRRLPANNGVEAVEGLIREYRNLVGNQKTIDQYIQYNRFWQRMIVTDRPRFDQLTRIYNLLVQSPDPETSQIVREVLGKPDVPRFIRVSRPVAGRLILHVPMYTDIESETYLDRIRTAIERFWHARDESTDYRVEVEFRSVRQQNRPRPGAHLDIRAHAAGFPIDGGVLTSGAETTYAFVGRFMALGPGDLSSRALAHEFGHVLGFRDGYVRGYRDLGEEGLEIMEVTSSFKPAPTFVPE